MLVKVYINAHYICAICRNSKSVAKKVAIFRKCVQKCFLFIGTDNTADGFYAGIAGRLGRKIIEGS